MSADARIALLDNGGSFTFALADALAACGRVSVGDSAAPAAASIQRMQDDGIDLVVLAPGAGPVDAQSMPVSLARQAAGQVPMLGIGAGFHAMALAFAARLEPAAQAMHGRSIGVMHEGHPLFAGMASGFTAGCYHSQDVAGLAEPLHGIASSPGGGVVAFSHRTQPYWGVQFHPESILTTHGQQLLRNAVALALAHRKEAAACVLN